MDTARIMAYVFAMDYSTLCHPPSRQQMFEQLNIENPLVILLVEHWIRVRRSRMEQEQAMMGKLSQVTKEFAKFQ